MTTVKTSLLNLISTPVPVLGSLGLDVAVGLSSEDPIGGRRASETYEAYLTMYAPDGRFAERVHLGEIPPRRRRLFDVGAHGRARFPGQDHLAVAHRIPRRLLADGRHPEDIVELTGEDAEYSMFRSVVQYALPGGGNGSVIYETPPSFNLPRPGRPPASTLTFTSKMVVGDDVETFLALMNYSVDPGYKVDARYQYAFFAPDGSAVGAGTTTVPAFTPRVLAVRELVALDAVARHRDAAGLAWLGYVGYCTDTAIIPLVLTVSRARGAVSVEHTHPAQAYTLPARAQDKHKVKTRAVGIWAQRLDVEVPSVRP